jgi:hypothetical protein
VWKEKGHFSPANQHLWGTCVPLTVCLSDHFVGSREELAGGVPWQADLVSGSIGRWALSLCPLSEPVAFGRNG